MAHSVRYLVIFAALVLAAIGRGAQAPLPARPLHFTVFAARPVADLAFVSPAGAAPQKIIFYPTSRSHRHEYRGAPPLRFVDLKSNQVVAEASIPPEIAEALLLFTPIVSPKAGGLRFQIAVLDDSAARHGAGGLAVINLSGLALSGVIGPHAVVLQPGLNPTLPVGRSAQMTLRAGVKDRTYQSYADRLEMNSTERALLLLFPPYYPGSLEVQSRLLLDTPPPLLPRGKAR